MEPEEECDADDDSIPSLEPIEDKNNEDTNDARFQKIWYCRGIFASPYREGVYAA